MKKKLVKIVKITTLSHQHSSSASRCLIHDIRIANHTLFTLIVLFFCPKKLIEMVKGIGFFWLKAQIKYGQLGKNEFPKRT